LFYRSPAATSGVSTDPVSPVPQGQGKTCDSQLEYISLESYLSVTREKDGVLQARKLSHPLPKVVSGSYDCATRLLTSITA
jgi:hypothetical protein